VHQEKEKTTILNLVIGVFGNLLRAEYLSMTCLLPKEELKRILAFYLLRKATAFSLFMNSILRNITLEEKRT